MSISGPPLLPGLMAASVCRKSWLSMSDVSPSFSDRRPLALMIPSVTDWLRPNGLPIASTMWPISTLSLSPQRAGLQVRGRDLHDGHVGGLVGPDLRGMDDPAVVRWIEMCSSRVSSTTCRLLTTKRPSGLAAFHDDARTGLFDQARRARASLALDVHDAVGRQPGDLRQEFARIGQRGAARLQFGVGRGRRRCIGRSA